MQDLHLVVCLEVLKLSDCLTEPGQQVSRFSQEDFDILRREMEQGLQEGRKKSPLSIYEGCQSLTICADDLFNLVLQFLVQLNLSTPADCCQQMDESCKRSRRCLEEVDAARSEVFVQELFKQHRRFQVPSTPYSCSLQVHKWVCEQLSQRLQRMFLSFVDESLFVGVRVDDVLHLRHSIRVLA